MWTDSKASFSLCGNTLRYKSGTPDLEGSWKELKNQNGSTPVMIYDMVARSSNDVILRSSGGIVHYNGVNWKYFNEFGASLSKISFYLNTVAAYGQDQSGSYLIVGTRSSLY